MSQPFAMNLRPTGFRLSGRLYLMIAISILGSASSVIRKLTELGAEQAMGGHNPISFCNVLFVGNLCALGLMIAIYQHQWRVPALKKISAKQWVSLSIVALLSSAIIPALIFSALMLTTVNNVILIGQQNQCITQTHLNSCLFGTHRETHTVARRLNKNG